MGKTIAIITDFAKTYWTDFKQEFNNNNRVQIDVLIFNDGAAQSTTIGDNHIAIKFPIDDGKSVVLIKQADPNINKTRMELVLNNWCQNITEIGIAAHANNGTLNVESLTNDKSYHYGTFNHYDNGSDPVWMKIKPLFNQLKSGGKDTKLFNALWSVLVPKPSDIAHRLRAEIVTPFMPLHLYYEINKKGDWKDILKSCCEEINKVENGRNIVEAKLGELLNLKTDLPEDMKRVQTSFDELKKYFAKNKEECLKTEDCHTKIKEFADCLENIVNFIEFGDVGRCP